MPNAFHDGSNCVSDMTCSGRFPRDTVLGVRRAARTKKTTIPTLGDVRADPRLVQVALAVRLDVDDHRVVVLERVLC